MFNLFDPQDDFRIRYGNLPHWYQPGVSYFITFRTEDSLPTSVINNWCRRRAEWLARQGISVQSRTWKLEFRKLPSPLQDAFHSEFSYEYLSHLDKGYGECQLRHRPIAEIVADSLRHFDETRYYLGDFVIMPNHVHLLASLIGDTDLERQCYSWKKFMAGKINKHLGTRGRFWQEESFDHLVRNEQELTRLQHYIARNGPEAHLEPDSYLHCGTSLPHQTTLPSA